MEIHEIGVHITIPNFISLISPLLMLYFIGVASFYGYIECHIECHGDEFCIKFYTTFKASATKSITPLILRSTVLSNF